jgi:hypothetical protein
MALHKKNYRVEDENWQTQDKSADRHLDRIGNAALIGSGKLAVRMPEMNGGTVIVALPYPAEFQDNGHAVNNGKVVKDRVRQDDPRSYNRWMFKADDHGVVRFGERWISVLFDNPDDSGWNYERDHPIQLIADNVNRAVYRKNLIETPYGSSDSDDWFGLVKESVKDGKKRYPIIKRPEKLCLVYAMVYHSGKNQFFSESGIPFGADVNDPLVLFVMLRSTVDAFMDAIDVPLQNDDPGAGLLHPEITGARYVHFYNKQEPCPTVRVAQVSSGEYGTVRRGPGVNVGSAKGGEGFGYAVRLTKTFDGTSNAPPLERDKIAAFATRKVISWENSVRGHSPEECADLVQDMAGLPLSVLHHCWAAHPEYINSVTRALMNRRVTSAPPASVGKDRGAAGVPDFLKADAVPANDPFSGSDLDKNSMPEDPGAGTDEAGGTDALYDNQAQSASDRLRAAMNRQSGGGLPHVPPPFNRGDKK